MTSKPERTSGESVERRTPSLVVKIVQTRLILSVLVFALAQLTRAFPRPTEISWIVLVYAALVSLLVLLPSGALEQKRIRAISILLDILTISFLIHSTGGMQSSWFLLYVFPIMSVSRYLGPVWSVVLAAFAMLAYGAASSINPFSETQAIYGFLFRAAILEGVALTAAKLARTRDRVESVLVRAIDEIDRLIVTATDFESVMQSIMQTAMRLTSSDLSAIALVDGGTVTQTFAATRRIEGRTERRAVEEIAEAERLVREYQRRVLDSRKPLSLPARTTLPTLLAAIRPTIDSKYWSARLIPLIGESPLGVLAVFSRRTIHYTPDDLRKLESLAPLAAIAHKNARLYGELARRLQMLHDINAELKAEKGLDHLFPIVARLVVQRLDSEEVALFTPDKEGERIEKRAECGPDDQTTARLWVIERSYARGQSLTGKVFGSKQPLLLNRIPRDEDHADDFSKELPSGTTRHYLGVPLLIGDEVLGVLRVLNKRGHNYEEATGEAKLAQEGFDAHDLELLTTIATLVASAIRNAMFIERNVHFKNLVYNSPDPIIVLDKNGRLENFNKECERIWGFEEWQVRGQPVEGYYESAKHARDIGRALNTSPTHSIRDYEARIRDHKGTVIPIRLSASLLVDKDGATIGSVGVFKDDREVLRIEEEKLRAERLAALGRLAQTTGHDIKHDLGAILNFVGVMERRARNDEQMITLCNLVRTSASDVLFKLQNMLLTAKPKPPDKQPLSLHSILTAFESRARHRASAANVAFIVHYPEGDPIIQADADQLRQVLANLFANSLDAIKWARHAEGRPDSGRIDVTLEILPNSVALSWQDDGRGLSAEVKEKAFTALFTTKDTGSGLGLFITKTIVEGHGGRITLESEEGQGACFRITIPLHAFLRNAELSRRDET